jgi:hypothetical protein
LVELTSFDICKLFNYAHLHPLEVHTSIFNMNGIMCYFPQKVVLQGNHYVKGSNSNVNKMEARLGSATFSFSNVQKIILQFGFVCCWKIWCKFFLYWCHKYLLINLFSFGDAKNAQGCWVNSLQEHIIIFRIWNVYFVCGRLHFGIKDQTRFIDNELSKALWNSKCNGLFIVFFKRCELSKNKI